MPCIGQRVGVVLECAKFCPYRVVHLSLFLSSFCATTERLETKLYYTFKARIMSL